MAQNWLNKDGLFIQFGTDQTTAEAAGEFALPGSPNRIVEVAFNLATANAGASINATPTIISNNLIFPAPPTGQLYIEKVELVVETLATSSGSPTLSVGLIQMDRATVPSNYNTAFINAEVLTALAATGTLEYFNPNGSTTSIPAGSTRGGGLIGTQPANATGPYYLTATGTATAFTAGIVRVRIYYRGIGVITQ